MAAEAGGVLTVQQVCQAGRGHFFDGRESVLQGF